MADKTDNLTTDQDLLDILESSSSDDNQKSGLEEAMSSDTSTKSIEEGEKEETDKKMMELQNIANKLVSSSAVSIGKGSGDIDEDLSNWFDGIDNLPSDELNEYVSNQTLKMDYGLTRNVLSSYKLMGKVRKFIEDDAYNALFSEQAVMGLSSDEILERLKIAFVIYKDLASLNAKINIDIKNYRLKSNSDTSDIDRLSLLLGSIPSEKLSQVLEGLLTQK